MKTSIKWRQNEDQFSRLLFYEGFVIRLITLRVVWVVQLNDRNDHYDHKNDFNNSNDHCDHKNDSNDPIDQIIDMIEN